MVNNKILLTAFQGTSAEMLVEGGSKNETYKTLFLPNDKIKDSRLLIKELDFQITPEHPFAMSCTGMGCTIW